MGHFEGFLKDLAVRNYSPESIRKYAHCVKLFLAYLGEKGISDIRKVGRDELNAYLEALSRNPKYSVHHVAANVRAVKCFFGYLKKSQVVLYDFSVVLKEPKAPYQLPKEPLTTKEVKLMLEAPDLRKETGIRDRAILETFYSTGIRVQEMSRLTLMDLDLEKGYLFIREGKGKKDRVVPLGKHACFFIQTYLQTVRPSLSAKSIQTLKTNRLWISNRGKPFQKMDITGMVRHYRKKVGIEKQVTPHSFRRTLAVELIRNECDFLSVREILGHSRSATTLRYCALAGVDLKEALKRCHPREADEQEDAKPHITSFGS
jgi:integrase/recombinase XerD